MSRIADVFRFRAEAVRLNWPFIADKMTRPQRGHHSPLRGLKPEQLRARAGDIRVTWAAAKELGVPYGPFTVWTRGRQDDRMETVDVITWQAEGGLAFWWGGTQAARIRVRCDVDSINQPVGLFLFRTSPSLYDAVASVAVQPSSNSVTLELSTSGAVMGLLVNGSNPQVAITRLDDVINDDAWKPIEIVGLPVERGWGTKYDTSDQGPIDDLMAPRDAAASRLLRGGPPFGWHPVTQAGRLAPEWSAPDSDALIEEVQKFVLPEIAGMYDGTVPEYDQWTLSNVRAVAPPRQGTRQSALATKADAKPWAALNIPAHSDAFLNLVTGFGSCYSQERMLPEQIGVGGSDFLITATYREIAPMGTGSAEFAAYAPQGIAHAQTPSPAALTAGRSGLVPPAEADLAWRETVRLNWKLTPTAAGLGIPTESALARYAAGAGDAEALIERRDPSGWRPLVLSADAPKPKPGSDSTSVVDGGAEILLGSGGRQVGYAVAVSDVYGVWSRWSDVPYSGDEPGPEGARLVSVALTTRFAGSTTCPSKLDLEVATEWLQRRTRSIDIVAVFFPMLTPTSDPPVGLSPTAVIPANCFKRDLGVDFAGDDPTGIGCDVTALNAEGTAEETAGPAQGDGGRRFAVHADVPTLDFGATRRWGVQIWVRRALFVGVTPSGWTPDVAHPALASAASPVPVEPLPLPPLPGVPLASLPDAEGRAHARVAWSLPAGAAVRTTAIWECAETALRQSVGLAPRAADTDPPGARLHALRTAYDALPDNRRRQLFRRLTELDGAVRDFDAVLPKGSTDIHLFAVTTVTDSGVESPWPSGPAETAVRVAMAPRLRHPAPPLVRSRPDATGNTVIEMSSSSPLPVARFRLLRTRSEGAARRADTMGPAFAEVAADPTAGPPDVVTGDPVYTAAWTGPFPESWDDWFVRAIAIPVDQVPVEAVRGMPSDPSDVVSFSARPDGPPDLAPIAVETDAAHTGIVLRTSTSAPVRPVPAGAHRVGVTARSETLPFVALQSVPETPLLSPPAEADTAVIVERGPRASGRSPLAVWFTRPVATDPVEVAVRIIDPFGRVTERTETVPGWVEPPLLDLSLIDVITVVGRGVAVVVGSDAPVDVVPPYELVVRATQRPRRTPFPLDPRLVGRPLLASISLPDIPMSSTPLPRGGIQFGWRRSDGHGRVYDIWIPLAGPLTATITLVAPDGGRITVTALA
ncbi:hypothetical protein IWX78_003047 [Mycetocola sp. CAN_C7]|uniref:hypothetical protein n=1 Tax=Mycetocola sp. CAN_C7 TaxID=2787724 RepID=UPI0018CBA9C4